MSNSRTFRPALLDREERKKLLTDEAMADLLRVILARGDCARFKAKGYSMHPFIKDGDIITLSPASKSNLVCGRIVGFIQATEGKFTVHRIIDKKETGFLIKGDNLSNPDGMVQEGCILGVVTGVQRNGKRVLFGHGPEGRLIARLWHLRPMRRIIGFTRRLLYRGRRHIQ